MKPSAVLIAGPTASGKSAVALALAERMGGVVINADSMQVYGDLRVLTARPSREEEARVPHRLYGHAAANDDYSVGRWLADVIAAIATARQEGQLPIVIGGTGLYFRALTQGLVAIPPIPPQMRTAIRAAAEGESAPVLHSRLATLDPETAFRLSPNDRQRILRALEVVEATGRSLAAWQRSTQPPALAPEGLVQRVLHLDREVLRRQIDRRFEAMMEGGALEEVERLAARHLAADRPLLKACGVPPLMRHLAGDLSRADAITQGQTDTRHYAKRQETWFRNQMPDWPRTSPQAALDGLMAEIAA
ncbi:tRNA (adenosine(37)-N6)-dimethylallyltransferase MiaA [Roseixanthobacter glucoisosaccharinicivorans]|uniref:tRNA (adenosine(37)-N6)-dimethylallyltransferase MiaA n=1 Tax=Roseixanthobacter glucoisosaccharinicivorans TaxID=3119923 RepID=UPI0037280117